MYRSHPGWALPVWAPFVRSTTLPKLSLWGEITEIHDHVLLSNQDPLTSRLLNRATPTLASVAGTSTFTSTPASRSVPLGPTIPLGPSAPLTASIPPAPTVTSNSTVVSSAKTTVPGRSGQRVFLLLLVVSNHLKIKVVSDKELHH